MKDWHKFVVEWERLSDDERDALGAQQPEPSREDLYGHDLEDGWEHLRSAELEPEPKQDLDQEMER